MPDHQVAFYQIFLDIINRGNFSLVRFDWKLIKFFKLLFKDGFTNQKRAIYLLITIYYDNYDVIIIFEKLSKYFIPNLFYFLVVDKRENEYQLCFITFIKDCLVQNQEIIERYLFIKQIWVFAQSEMGKIILDDVVMETDGIDKSVVEVAEEIIHIINIE
jgi:hypothetical protein